jgi:hypothetical protein
VELQPRSAQRTRCRREIVGERIVEDDGPYQRVGARSASTISADSSTCR